MTDNFIKVAIVVSALSAVAIGLKLSQVTERPDAHTASCQSNYVHQAGGVMQLGGATTKQTAVAMGGACGDAYCDPFKPVDILSMTKQADLIVVGKFEQVQGPRYLEIAHGMNNPSNSAAKIPLKELKAQMFLTIKCDRVLKGATGVTGRTIKWVDPNWERNIHTDSTNGVTFTTEYQGGTPQLIYGIFFLKKTDTGFEYLDRAHCVLPASPASMKVDSDPLIAVTNELNSVLLTPVDVLTAGAGATGGESGAGPGDTHSYSISSGEVLMRDTIVVLSQLPKTMAIENLKSVMVRANTPLAKLWTFAGLVNVGDWTYLSQVQEFLLQPSDSLKYVAAYPFDEVEKKLRSGQRAETLLTVSTIPLTKLLKSTNVNIRQSVSYILAEKNDRTLLDTLALIATTDSDETVRANCRCGLEKMTNIVAELWEKEPILAKELASDRGTIGAVNKAMGIGSTFNQSTIAPQLISEFCTPAFNRKQFPQWLTQALSRLDGLNSSENNNLRSGLFSMPASSEFVPSQDLPQWSCEGSSDPSGKTKAWYTFTKTYDLSSKESNLCSIRTTTMCFMILLNGQDFPQMVAIGQLAPAKILDVWRQDDTVIFKHLPSGAVRVVKARSLYGAKGNRLQVAPSGMHTEATLFDIAP